MRVGSALRAVALGYLARPPRSALDGLLAYVRERPRPRLGRALDAGDGSRVQDHALITAIAVPANTVFGVVCALAIVRRRFPGKGLLNAFVDLPLALSPVVVGLSLFLALRPGRLVRRLAARHGVQVLFALPVDGDRDDLRLAAVRRARGRADAPRDRRRAGAGCAHARRLGLADVLADHAAVHPLGA